MQDVAATCGNAWRELKFSPPVMTLCLAILAAMVQHVWCWRVQHSAYLRRGGADVPTRESQAPSILVVGHSLCDGGWVDWVDKLLQAASNPTRVHIAVVEYVHHLEDSAIKELSKTSRHRVRVHTSSAHMATSRRSTREFCLRELYASEDFVLLCESLQLPRGWDETLIARMSDGVVLTQHVAETPRFPVVARVEQDEVVFAMQEAAQATVPRAVSILLCATEFLFAHAAVRGLLVRHDTAQATTAELIHHGVSVMDVGVPMATQLDVPRLVSMERKPPSQARLSPLLRRYHRTIGVNARDRQISARAELGVTASPDKCEYDFKYGSVMNGRLQFERVRMSRATKKKSRHSSKHAPSDQ